MSGERTADEETSPGSHLSVDDRFPPHSAGQAATGGPVVSPAMKARRATAAVVVAASFAAAGCGAAPSAATFDKEAADR
jgi:hypothetical protein